MKVNGKVLTMAGVMAAAFYIGDKPMYIPTKTDNPVPGTPVHHPRSEQPVYDPENSDGGTTLDTGGNGGNNGGNTDYGNNPPGTEQGLPPQAPPPEINQPIPLPGNPGQSFPGQADWLGSIRDQAKRERALAAQMAAENPTAVGNDPWGWLFDAARLEKMADLFLAYGVSSNMSMGSTPYDLAMGELQAWVFQNKDSFK